MQRREFLEKLGLGAATIASQGLVSSVLGGAPYIKRGDIADRVIVLGIDGMDPQLLSRFVAEGIMPNFEKFIAGNHCGNLRTTMPPQSPVAWSSFISGMNPGGHGIFDFIHRDPATLAPYLSTSSISGAAKNITVGNWSIPVGGGDIELLRRGPAFWTLLEEHGIPATLFKLPANFPPLECHSHTISGLGTPDVLGTYGTFSYYSDAEIPGMEDLSGGEFYPVRLDDHAVTADLVGPQSFSTAGEPATIEFTLRRDPVHKVARINVQGQEIILKQGDWSKWIPFQFELLPHLAKMPAMAQFYLQEVHPHLKLYVSPINIDPMDPALPICTPEGYSRELATAIGRYCTKGFPEETKALSHGVFSNSEYMDQADGVLKERLLAYDYELNRFQEGLFFFYFSSIDQNTHMLWRNMDPSHHLYEPDECERVKHAIRDCYRTMDDVLAQALSKVDPRTRLMVVSDHGFAPFRREFNLSTWLVENGYAAVLDPDAMGTGEFFSNADWKKTRAYALGINGLYINVQNRDLHGNVKAFQKRELAQEIAEKLMAYRDPLNGQQVVLGAYPSHELYRGPYSRTAPDLMIGYNRGYRISDQAVLGTFPPEVIADRQDKWAADHCMDASVVPGVLLANRRVTATDPGLEDMAPSILGEFGLEAPAEMDGRKVFEQLKV